MANFSINKFSFSGNKLPKPKGLSSGGSKSSTPKAPDPLKGTKLPSTSGSGGGKAKVGATLKSTNKIPKPAKIKTPKPAKSMSPSGKGGKKNKKKL